MKLPIRKMSLKINENKYTKRWGIKLKAFQYQALTYTNKNGKGKNGVWSDDQTDACI